MSRALLLVLLAACKPQHTHDDAGEGHSHGDPRKTPERPTLHVTRYQSGLEVFIEHPALAVNEPSPLVAHVTDARDARGFRPVTKGRVTVTLRQAGGADETFTAEQPLRDGVFKLELKPARAGEATLTLSLEGEQLAGTVELGKVTVHPSLAAAVAAAAAQPAPAERTIAFLKEQQWKTEYATAPAEERVLQGGVRANGELKAVPGQAAELSAPVPGRLPVGEPVPALGQRVKKGELLVRVLPTSALGTTDLATVDLEASRARAELGLAERELGRAKEMFAAQAIPEKQVDAAKVAVEVAAAKVQAAEKQRAVYRGAQSGGAQGGGTAFELRSPIDGVVSYAEVMPGAVVEAGKKLVAVVNADRLWLEARVFETDVPKVEQSPGAAFTVTGFEREFVVDEHNGRRVAVGAVVDRATRTVPVVYELQNPDGRLKPGMSAKVTLFTGETVRGLAVPEAAVVDDDGKPVVFVLAGGESFYPRAIKPGIRSGGFVHVLDGVKPGERVVSRGAYELKLASSSGTIPDHGHAH